MKAIIQEKAKQVEVIAGKLKESQTTVIVDYRGLNVKQATELRKELREAGVEFKVHKNSLVTRAVDSLGIEGMEEFLTGPNAIASCATDAVLPAKIISEFAKKNEQLEIKAGIVDGKKATVAEIEALASLPSREGLLSMLLSVLQAPVRNFALATKAVAEQKEGAESA